MINTSSFTYKNGEDFAAKLENSLSTCGFIPSLAFCFISIELDIEQIMQEFSSRNIKLIGASSCGEILFDNKEEVVSDKGAVITLTDIKPEYFSIQSFSRENQTSVNFGELIGQTIKNNEFPASAIIVASGLSLDGQALVESAVKVVGNDLVMFGGLAGDDSKFENTVVFDEDTLLENGAKLLLLNKNKIKVSGIASSGWIGLGADLTVTKSEGNTVYTIDDKPALDVYKEYLNVTDEEMPAIGIEFPLMIKHKNGNTALRAVLGINRDDRSLIFAGSVVQGSKVTFSSSPGFEVINKTTSKLQEYYEKDSEADFFILFSCMARHLALGPMVSQEISYAARTWKAPVIGFFTYGEIGLNSQHCDFFNQTYTLVKLSSS